MMKNVSLVRFLCRAAQERKKLQKMFYEKVATSFYHCRNLEIGLWLLKRRAAGGVM